MFKKKFILIYQLIIIKTMKFS